MALRDWYAELRTKRALSRAAGAYGAVDSEWAIGAFRSVAEASHASAAARRRAHEGAAELLAKAGRTGEAIRHLHDALAICPDDSAALQSLAKRLKAAGDATGAVAAWRRVLGVEPTSASAHAHLARILYDLDLKAEAVPHLRVVAQGDPDEIKTWRKLAVGLAASSDREGEMAALQEVSRLDAADPAAHARLADVLQEDGLYAEAAVHLRALAEARPDQAEPWRRLAAALMQAGDAEGEVQAIERALNAQPEDPAMRDRVASLLGKLGRPAAAAVHLKALAEAEPGDVAGWRRLADALQGTDAAAEVEAVKRALVIEPGDLGLRERAARLFGKLGRKLEAATHLRVIAEAAPEDPRWWRQLAEALKGTDPEGEVQAWRRVLAADPGAIAAHQRLVELLNDLGRPAETPTHLWAIVEANPDRIKLWRRLADQLARLGDVEGEIAAWRRALALDPFDPQSHERLALIFEERGRVAEAVPHLRVMAESGPGQAKTWKRLARGLAGAEGELEAWRRTLELSGSDTEAHQRLAQLYYDQGRYEEARPYLEAIVVAAGYPDKAWRRLARVMRETGAAQRDIEPWRHVLQLAGAQDLDAVLLRMEGLVERRDDLEQALDRAQKDLKRDRAVLQSTLQGLHDERGAHRETQAMLREELAQRRRLVLDLQEGRQRQRQAEAEEGYHLAAARTLALIAPGVLETRQGAPSPDARAPETIAAGLTSPIDPDLGPTRLIIVVSSDDAVRQAVSGIMGGMTSLAFAQEFAAAMLGPARAGELDLDQWLSAAWAAQGQPRVLGLSFDADTFSLFARNVPGRLTGGVGRVFRRARVLQLTWSDKLLFAAVDRQSRVGGLGDDFDSGDAQIEVNTYRRLVEADARIEGAVQHLGAYGTTVIKMYRELLDKHQLARFCRDVGLPVDLAGFKDIADSDLEFSPSEGVHKVAALVGEAVLTLTAARDPDASAEGLNQFALARPLERLGRHAEARDAYLQAVELAPTYFPARAAAARYLELSGEIEQAERLLRKGLAASGSDQAARNGLLEFYQRNNQPSGVAAVSRLMRLDGRNRRAITAPALVELRRYRQAAPLLNVLAPKTAPESFLWDLLDLPALAAALGDLRAAARDDGSPDAHFRLAEALRRLDHLDEALESYGRALAEPGALAALTGVEERCQPGFLVVGPPRTGTTLLRRVLDLHPDIAMPSGEPSFFSSRSGERSGSNRRRAPLSWYLAIFRTLAERKPEAVILGEKSPHYFSTDDTTMAFARLLFPNLKIVVTLRDPVERAWSEIKVQGRMDEAAVIAALNRGRYPNWFGELLDAGHYLNHLERWSRHFPREQMLLIDAEVLETEVAPQAKRLFEWLGRSPAPRQDVLDLQRTWNNRTPAFARDDKTVELLRTVYAGEVWAAADLARILDGSSDRPVPVAARTPPRTRAARKAL